ncbi:RFC2 [Symbiodinium pilosum]|uniref:RFC2 protein n=1 Tax=Symbiodinium pilosum TaxID=2952 RepID=A0A812X2Z3_SYMPI|nr:RFC2 [Symbiodinium pilosum]
MLAPPAPWVPLLVLGVATQRVVPDWRQVEGDVNWFVGCGLGNFDIRGAIAAGLEQNKVRKHVAFCLSHCGPPSCTLKAAETNCDCLKCTMFCLSRGSYVDSCLNNHTYDMCTGFMNDIYDQTNRSCDVNCNSTVAGLLRPVLLRAKLLRFVRFVGSELGTAQEEVVSALKHSLQTGELPNLMFYGPPGTGKTTVALALMKQFFGQDWRARVKELNASDERGITAVREKVKTFAQLALGGESHSDTKARFRVIILDEADSMTHDAQAALRRIMEEFVHVTRFIIICNYVSKIIEPLHSRCSKFRFQLVGAEFQKARLLHICAQEKVAVSSGALEQLISLSKGDMRCAVTMLQTAVQVYDKVDEASLVEVFCAVPEWKTKELLAFASRKTAETDQVLQAVRNFLLDGFSGLQVMEQLLELVAEDTSLPDGIKAKCAMLFSQADERLCQGCDEELQLFDLFANLRPLIQAR